MSIIKEIFGTTEGIRVFFAPGRVNLIGEHTDFTGGYVFPAALTYGTWALVRPRQDGIFRFVSTSFPGQVLVNARDLEFRQQDGWANYPKGVILEMARQGVPLSGFDVLYHGNIPAGAGLSSSASLELVTAIAHRCLENTRQTLIDLVKLAQRAENEFVGVNCGIMDQFAVGMGKARQAILLKCDTLAYRYVPLELGKYRLVVTHTNKPRNLTGSKYNERRNEVEQGFLRIRPLLEGVACLGDVSVKTWYSVRTRIEVPAFAKRLEHVVRENARTLAAGDALEKGDLSAFGKLMLESHESLRHLYEVTGYELDTLVEEACNVEGCLGTRMTGAGFGGCTVSLVHEDAVADFQEKVKRGYEAKSGLSPTFYLSEIGDGTREITGEAAREIISDLDRIQNSGA